MLAGTISQAYTWKWVVEQTDAALTMHILNHQDEMLRSLASDALKTHPFPDVLYCTVKVLKTLNHCFVPHEKLSPFIHILKEQGLIPSNDNDHVNLFKEALAINNFDMAKNILEHLGTPNAKLFDAYDTIRRAMEKGNENLICFILQNKFIHSRSLLKSIFGTACDKLLYKVVDTLIDKIPDCRVSQETVDYNLREALKKNQERLVDQLATAAVVSLEKDEKSKSNLLYYTCTLKPGEVVLVEKMLALYKRAPDFTEAVFNSLVNKACKKAAIFANNEIVKFLIRKGANVDLHIISSLLYQREDEFVIELLERYPQTKYDEILFIAIRVGAEFVVIKLLTDFEEEILKKRHDSDREKFYLELLEIAFKDRNSMAAFYCIEKIKKPLAQGFVDGLIAHALSNESEGLLILLFEHHLVPRSSLFSFLMHCSRLGFEEATRYLLRLQINPNQVDKGGLTPLMIAVAGGHVRVADLLITAGAKIQACDSAGNTPLHYAAYVGSEASIKLLITRGALVNSCNNLKATPLHLAAEEGWENSVKLLLFHNADRLARNENGQTALHLAIDCDIPSHALIESLLLSNDAMAIPDYQGRTPFAMLLQKNMHKHVQQFFFPYSSLTLLEENLKDFDRMAVSRLREITNPANLSYAVPFELALLLNNYPLAHALSQRYTPVEIGIEMHKLHMRYPACNMQMLWDAKYGFHSSHFTKDAAYDGAVKNSIPVFSAALDFMRNQILEEFDKINFSNKNQKNYRNPDTLRNDGSATKPELVREGLAELFKRVKNRTPFLGTPPENSPDLLPWYEKLERLLVDLSTLVLKKKEEDEKASLLIEMGIAGLHCGGRWVGTLRQLYQLETSSITFKSLPDHIHSELRQARQGFMQSLTDENNVHQYNHFLYLVGEDLGLIAKDTRDKYLDTLADQSETQETVLTKFYKMYNPTFVIDSTRSELNHLAKKSELREVIIDWFKENLPKEWKPDEDQNDRVYSYLIDNLYDENQRFEVSRAATIHMLLQMNILK